MVKALLMQFQWQSVRIMEESHALSQIHGLSPMQSTQNFTFSFQSYVYRLTDKGYDFAKLLLSYVSLENKTRTIDKMRLKIMYSQYYQHCFLRTLQVHICLRKMVRLPKKVNKHRVTPINGVLNCLPYRLFFFYQAFFE